MSGKINDMKGAASPKFALFDVKYNDSGDPCVGISAVGEMRRYVLDFLTGHDYPEEATRSLLEVFDTIAGDVRAKKRFFAPIELYENDQLFDFSLALNAMNGVSEECGVNAKQAQLLLMLCFTRRLKARYEERGLSDELYECGVADLRHKMDECRVISGLYGSDVGAWFARLFDLTRLAPGRLQFELRLASHDFKVGDAELVKGGLVLAIHIPSGSPMDAQACLDSIFAAAEMYRPMFCGPVPFTCSSWLLYPAHKKYLPETSNIRRFMDLFTTVEVADNAGADLWRIFGRSDCSDYASLPEDTSLRRIYKKMLLGGEGAGKGVGYFFADGKKLLR